MLSFSTRHVVSIAARLHDSVDRVREQIDGHPTDANDTAPSGYTVVTTPGGTNFWVDYERRLFGIGETVSLFGGEGTRFELPEWTGREYHEYVDRHLRTFARNTGGNDAVQRLHMKGGAIVLAEFVNGLQLLGDRHVAALSIESVMQKSVEEAMRQCRLDLERSPWARQALAVAWHELCELACQRVYGRLYGRALRRERVKAVAIWIPIFGALAAPFVKPL